MCSCQPAFKMIRNTSRVGQLDWLAIVKPNAHYAQQVRINGNSLCICALASQQTRATQRNGEFEPIERRASGQVHFCVRRSNSSHNRPNAPTRRQHQAFQFRVPIS